MGALCGCNNVGCRLASDRCLYPEGSLGLSGWKTGDFGPLYIPCPNAAFCCGWAVACLSHHCAAPSCARKICPHGCIMTALGLHTCTGDLTAKPSLTDAQWSRRARLLWMHIFHGNSCCGSLSVGGSRSGSSYRAVVRGHVLCKALYCRSMFLSRRCSWCMCCGTQYGAVKPRL